MTPAERAFLERARVGSLATVDARNRPHPVPICYALVDGAHEVRLVSAIDEKPKSTRELRRVRNIRSNPWVSVLVDRYSEDWSRLAWVQVRGRADVVHPDESGHEAAVRALRSTYEQYDDHDLQERPVVSIRIDETRSWGALEEWT
ncbi:TIGR03668 family PPOX class F420-dependent oxidoreductase [Natronococcus pandeyae]|uniref:TIGR03668 family PPOX class F420-dependent oxidoreductase n=1 Tax=Natronococcus pandeyae TaxID=2055836 RepID=A0A8J8TR15_9EURY|nr:TIGR03668 family PPOX class F420-dependent oxidoreductase [Natronococcus pandeyae]TYL37087.1 TIGR03668 family PPOX class F420-dependent oxidoreductase [Natronococcus pandeyae]